MDMINGLYTNCDLSDARCLLQRDRGVYTQNTLCMALELSRLVYGMDIAPCLDAGWEDVSFLVDDLTLTNLHGGDMKARKGCLQAAAKVRSRMEKLDPLSQFMGFRRQRESLDTCKAMVLAKPLWDEKTMIVISFAGTTKRLYEWLSNLRLEEANGFHAGFLALTKQFEESAARIAFPQTAQRMGFSRLTLQDVLQQLRMGSEHYHLFVTGHSQGAALTQVYIHHLIASGVPAKQLLGVGFASPSVVSTRAVQLAANYPVLNIINADDVIARVGGRMHIGMCSVLPASQAYRSACYGKRAQDAAFLDALSVLHTLRSTEDTLLFGIALADALSVLPENESEEILLLITRSLLPDALAQRLKGYARRMARGLSRRLTAKCLRVVGCLDEAKLQKLRAEIQMQFTRHGAAQWTGYLAEVMLRPHTLAEKDNPRAYQLLTTAYVQSLTPSLWLEDRLPVWDMQFKSERKPRIRKAYHRLRPLSSQKQSRKKT